MKLKSNKFRIKYLLKDYKQNTLIDNYKKILISMMPVIPHLSNECLNLINVKDINWPKYDKNLVKEEIANIVVQINGKKRGLVKTEIDISENDLLNIINNDEKILKYVDGKEIKKKIYIKNKLINIIL